MMRVLLLTVPLEESNLEHDFMRQRRWWLRTLGIRPLVNVMPSFALLYLAPPLKKAGHAVSYLDGYFFRPEDLLQRIAALEPEVVLVTTLTFNWPWTCAFLSRVRAWSPRLPIVIGGVHVTVTGAAALQECPAATVAVEGEGERTVTEVVAALADGRDFSGIPGVLWRRGEEIVRNGTRERIQEIDEIDFPDRDLIEVPLYRPSPIFYRRLPNTSIIGARGCPYPCTFCHTDPLLRMRSPGNVVAEVEECVRRYGVRDFSFWDDAFTIKRSRAVAICEEILRRGLDVTWCASIRADQLDLELAHLMRRAGCWRVLLGIESGVEKNLKRLRKPLRLEKVREVVEVCRQARLGTLGLFILGIPGETFEEALRTIDFACSLKLDWADFNLLAPFPGTKIYEEILADPKEKLLPGARFDMKNPSYVPSTMTFEELTSLPRLAFRRFYLRPGTFLAQVRGIRSWEGLRNAARGFLTLVGTE